MATNLEQKVKAAIRDVPDFPKPGILFKDITPVLADAPLCVEIVHYLGSLVTRDNVDAIAAVEARGFLFGFHLANLLGLPFIPIRKQGKLPYSVVRYAYTLEYGTSTIEMHEDAVKPGMRIAIHDDLLATGGTAAAAASLVQQQGAEVADFLFLIELEALKGRQLLESFGAPVQSLVRY